jgi:hypothetical protein
MGFIIDLDFRIVQLTTDSATLEWAVPEDKLEWALGCFQGSESPAA